MRQGYRDHSNYGSSATREMPLWKIQRNFAGTLRDLSARSLLDKPVAGVRVVIDPVLFLQFLDVPQGRFGVGAGDAVAERFVGVQQDFFEATVQGHAFVRSEIVEERSEAFLEAHGNIDAFDLERWSLIVDVMSEIEFVAVQVADAVITQAIRPVAGRDDDFHTVGAVEF